jgi:hypothetical protein
MQRIRLDLTIDNEQHEVVTVTVGDGDGRLLTVPIKALKNELACCFEYMLERVAKGNDTGGFECDEQDHWHFTD